MTQLVDVSDDLEYHDNFDDEEQYLDFLKDTNMSIDIPSLLASSGLLNVLPEKEYSNKFGCPEPIQMFTSDVEADIQAIIIGVMMAKGEKLDNGITADEFDQTLQSITGKTTSNKHDFISMMGLAYFMKMSAAEIDKYNKNKGNLLFHKIFEDLIHYDHVLKTFKLKIPIFLEAIHNDIRVSSTCRAVRKITEERVKLQKLANPINRMKYMLSNNFLVEMIISVCNKKCIEEVPWVAIQQYYCDIMLKENELFKKYDEALQLSKLRDTKGNQLNENSCRELFGRGTISKALSDEIYNKIKFINSPKGLILRLDGDFRKQAANFTYGKDDFVKMTKTIQEYETMKKKKVVQKKRVLHHSLTKQEREERELFNRRDSYEPIKLNIEDFFCSREPLKTQKDYINERFAIESAAHKYSDNEESVVRKTKSISQSARQASRMDSSIEETFQTAKKSNGMNIFGDNIFDSNCSSLSGVSEQSRDLGQLYTDEEIEIKPKKSPKVKKAEATPEKDNIIYLNPTHFLSDTKLRKKNGSFGLAEKIVHNKMVVFFFGAYWSSSSREVTQLLREVHSTLKVCKEPFEIIYVSYDNSVTEYDRYIKEYHGDWASIEFESKKEELIKGMFPKICVPGLVVVRAEGTIITTRGLEDLMIYSKKPSSLYKLWKERNLYKRPVDQKGASKFVSEATRKVGHLEQMTNDKDQVSIKNLEAKQFITKKKEDKGPQNQVPLERNINTGSYGDFGIPSRRIITNNSKRNEEAPRNIVNSTTIFINDTAKKYNQSNLSEDIEALPMKDLFMQFIKYHVFLHRSIEGASKRYWSRMQQGLEPPFNLPHVIIGNNWTEMLVEKVPCLQVTKTHSGDLFFDWLNRN